MRFRNTVALIFCLIFCNLLNTAFSDDIKYDSVLSEIRTSWDKLKSEYQKGVDVSIQYSSVSEQDIKQKMRIYFDNSFELNHFFSKKELLKAINKKYAFDIIKDTGSPDWAIKNFFDNPTMAREGLQYFNKILWGTSVVYGGILVEEAWGMELLNSGSFKLISIKKKKIDNDEFVEIQFKSDFMSHKTSKILGGRILFDPNLYWVIREYEFDVEALPVKDEKSEFAVVKRVIDYQNIDGVPFPKKCDICYRYYDGSIVSHLIFDFNSVERGKIPQEIFYLKNYGLSEPVNSFEIRNKRIQIICVLVGLFLIIVGLLMKFLAKKNSKE
jgi:hypothetical protein